MGAKVCKSEYRDGTLHGWMVHCPACKSPHIFDKRWTFDGNQESPTFGPSMLVVGYPDDNNQLPEHPRCHSYLNAGVWNYLPDCSHPMKGKNVPAPDWDRRLDSSMPEDTLVNPEHLAMAPKDDEAAVKPLEETRGPAEVETPPPAPDPKNEALYAASRKHMMSLEGSDMGMPKKAAAMLLAYVAATECSSTEELAAHGTTQTLHRASWLRTFAPVMWFQILDASAEGLEAACHRANQKAVPAKVLQELSDVFARA